MMPDGYLHRYPFPLRHKFHPKSHMTDFSELNIISCTEEEEGKDDGDDDDDHNNDDEDIEENDENGDNDDGEEDDELSSYDERLTAAEGLSKETLAMLGALGLIKDENERTNMIYMTNGDPERLNLKDLDATAAVDAIEALKQNGVVRINNILSSDLCDACVTSIEASLALAIAAGTDHFCSTEKTGFGNVDIPGCRWDMYLDNKDAIADSYRNMLSKGSVLRLIFDELFEGQDAEIHEFGALISKLGALSQRVHSDTTYQLNCPLYTVFIAMQDVVREMGPTLFIKGTNSSSAHHDLRHKRDSFLSKSTFHQALLRRGDVVIMDSRTFHCGDSNIADSRILLYFTLLNPSFSDMGGGSKFEHLQLSLHGFAPV